MNSWYTFGLSLMRHPPFPGSITVGAWIVRVGRELDTNEARQLRAWDAAHRILEEHKRKL